VFTGDARIQRVGPIVIPQQIYGPIFDARSDRILAVQGPSPARGMNLFPGTPPLLVGQRKNAWSRKKAGTAPIGTLALLPGPGGEVVPTPRAAVSGLASDEQADSKPDELQLKFVRSGPEPALRLEPSATAAMNSDTGAIAIFSSGIVTVLEPDASGKYVRKAE